MKTEYVTIATSQLMAFREFDRMANPAPCIPFVQQYTLEQVKEWVSVNGIQEPLELSVFEHKVLLTDGNHRLAAASLLNIKEVPVKLVYYDTLEQLEGVFYPHTIARFKTLND